MELSTTWLLSLPRPIPACEVYPSQFIQNEAVLRGVSRSGESLTAGETIALDSQPHDIGPDKTAGRARVLPAVCCSAKVEQARVGAPDQVRSFRACCAYDGQSLTIGETNSSGSSERLQRRLHAGIPGPPDRPCRN